jgi:hypothetical protein
MYSNIPFGHRAENGVDHGVADHIRIRVAHEAHSMGNLNAAENKLTSPPKSMNVETMSYAKFSNHASERRFLSGASPKD